jgi:3-methyladenine DNA glycosylase Tag
MELYNFSQPTQPFIPNLAIAAVDALSAYQHQTFGVYDAASANTTPLNDFDNFIQDPDIIRAEISLNAPPENVNEWYSSTMIRKFGVFLWDVDIQQTPMEFINRQVSVFLSPQAQQMKGCLVNLQKNCKGEITTYKAAQRLTTLVSIDGGVTYKPWAMGGTFGTPQFPS